jgi:hypothetical protein
MFAHIASAIRAQEISPRSTLTPEVVADLIDNFHKRDLSSYKGGEFVSVGELILYGNGRKDMSIEVMVDRKAEFAFANFSFDGFLLCSEVWQYTRKTTFEAIYKHPREDWFDLFVEILLNDLERAVVKGIYDYVITEEMFLAVEPEHNFSIKKEENIRIATSLRQLSQRLLGRIREGENHAASSVFKEMLEQINAIKRNVGMSVPEDDVEWCDDPDDRFFEGTEMEND